MQCVQIWGSCFHGTFKLSSLPTKASPPSALEPHLSQCQSSTQHLWPPGEIQWIQQQVAPTEEALGGNIQIYTKQHLLLCSKPSRGWLSPTVLTPNGLAQHPRASLGQHRPAFPICAPLLPSTPSLLENQFLPHTCPFPASHICSCCSHNHLFPTLTDALLLQTLTTPMSSFVQGHHPSLNQTVHSKARIGRFVFLYTHLVVSTTRLGS